jgi:hypothetical protein
VSDVLHAALDLTVLAPMALVIGWRSEGGLLATLGAFRRTSITSECTNTSKAADPGWHAVTPCGVFTDPCARRPERRAW